MAIGRWLPPAAADALIALLTSYLHGRKASLLYRTLYYNQAGVAGPGATSQQLDAAVMAVLRHSGRAAYDLMQIMSAGEASIVQSLHFPPGFRECADAARENGRGVMVCGVHLSNFNLGMLAFALRGFPVQVLSTATDARGGGFRIMADLRNRGMLEETPISPASLRQAARRLREGGVVATGVDWPSPPGVEPPVPFFRQPSLLSDGSLRLAMAARANVFPMACRWSAARGYEVIYRPHLELKHTGNRERDLSDNMEAMLAGMEAWITETPEQWLMYHAVWPLPEPTEIPAPGAGRSEA